MTLVLGAVAAIVWLAVLLLPSRPWSTRERIEPLPATADRPDLRDVTVIVPARNEARHLPATIHGLALQGAALRVVVVDDQSTDATAAVVADAARSADPAIELVSGAPLPPGWGGKLWALEQGRAHASTRWILLLDADIEIAPGMVGALLDKADETGAELVSVMATLRCVSFWERLLVPPFVYFFKLIYPFMRVGEPRSRVAAAAGGCVLVRAEALDAIGAFESLRDALIDDCTLAACVKRSGRGLWLGLSHGVRSQRRYESFTDFSRMITRTAFTQLNYSLVLLLLVSALMLVVFGGPFVAVWNHPDSLGVSLGMLGLGSMLAGFIPVHRWYALPVLWLLTLPLAAALYLVMTWRSAIDYWRGTRARWKGRAYVVH